MSNRRNQKGSRDTFKFPRTTADAIIDRLPAPRRNSRPQRSGDGKGYGISDDSVSVRGGHSGSRVQRCSPKV